MKLSNLSLERPIGVSGLLRTKNGADFLSQCIDSCINALDELIIVWQESSDDTEKIILEKQKQYPDKIHAYFYEPKVYSHNLSEQEFDYAKNLPYDSEHLLCNYYNFALSKAKYKFVVKIDDDQIYFSKKLKEILDLYRTNKKVKINFFEKAANRYYKKLYRKISIKPKYLNSFNCNFLAPKFFLSAYISYLKKKIQNDKIVISLSGVNLFDNKIPIAKNEDEKLLTPFNGTFDTLLFPVCDKTYYIPYYDRKNLRIIEKFNHPFDCSAIYHLGFFWIHLKHMKRDSYEEVKNDYRNKTADIDKFLSCNYFKFEKQTKYRKFDILRLSNFIFFTAEKKMLALELKKYVNGLKVD